MFFPPAVCANVVGAVVGHALAKAEKAARSKGPPAEPTAKVIPIHRGSWRSAPPPLMEDRTAHQLADSLSPDLYPLLIACLAAAAFGLYGGC